MQKLNKICELSLLTHGQIATLLNECEYDKIPDMDMDIFTKLLLPNDFYFLVRGQRDMKLECDGVTNEITLNGSGVVHLNRNCEIFDNEVVMKSHLLINLREQYGQMKNMIIPIIISNYGLKEVERKTVIGSTKELEKSIQELKIDEVKVNMEKERNRTITQKVATHPVFHRVIGMAVGLIAAGLIWYRWCRPQRVMRDSTVRYVVHGTGGVNAHGGGDGIRLTV